MDPAPVNLEHTETGRRKRMDPASLNLGHTETGKDGSCSFKPGANGDR